MVEATLNYLAPMAERPEYYQYPPPEGTSWRNTKGDRRRVRVDDARVLSPAPGLDDAGFTLARLETRAGDLYDAGTVREHYYPEVQDLVADVTGAAQVLAFDHNLRHADRAKHGAGIQTPVRFVHNDYTKDSGPQRVRDLVGEDEARALIARRFAVVNVWKPISGPVLEAPLACCDARTLAPDDFVPTDLRYRDRVGEIYSLYFSDRHRWFYYPQMRADEALLLKCYDSESAMARFTAHTAIDDPTSPVDAPVRESIEVRTLAFF